jgi:uncharacterized protein YecE (DUF72 family)
MAIWVGTSGFQYPQWRGYFYPEDMKEAAMLGFYSERFPTVEINYSYYRWPSEKSIKGWVDGTPENYRIILKMNRRVTDQAKLVNVGDTVRDFWRTSETLGAKRGPILITVPPWVKKDMDVLNAFLEGLPEGFKGALELRSSTWDDDAVRDAMAKAGQALCVSEGKDHKTPVARTADYAYFRLRNEEYSVAEIDAWAKVIGDWQPHCQDIYAFFMHEDFASGPRFGKMLLEALGMPAPEWAATK